MFNQSDNYFCTHAAKLEQLFVSIQENGYSSYCYQHARLPKLQNQKPSSESKKITHISKTLEKAQSEYKQKISNLNKELLKIDCNKKQEIKEILCSNKPLSNLENKIIEKMKKTQDEHDLEIKIDYHTRELDNFNLHAEVCSYLKSPNRVFNALEIVLKYEKAHMQHLYNQNTEQNHIISSYFTNITKNKTVIDSIDSIKKYISDHTLQLHNTIERNNLSSNIVSISSDDTGDAASDTTMPVVMPRSSIGWSLSTTTDNASVLGDCYSLHDTDNSCDTASS